MIEGRRHKLPNVWVQARRLRATRVDLVRDTRSVYVARLVLALAWFVAFSSFVDRVPEIPYKEFPSLIYPFAALFLVERSLRRITLQTRFAALAQFHIPLVEQFSQRLTTQFVQLRIFDGAALYFNIEFLSNEAIKATTLFSQRLTNVWLQLKTELESFLNDFHEPLTPRFSRAVWAVSSLVIPDSQLTPTNRPPFALVLRC
jgi:hypothetical protein